MSKLGLCDCGRPWEYTQHSMGDILTCNECNVAWDCHDAIVEITAKVERLKKLTQEQRSLEDGDA